VRPGLLALFHLATGFHEIADTEGDDDRKQSKREPVVGDEIRDGREGRREFSGQCHFLDSSAYGVHAVLANHSTACFPHLRGNCPGLRSDSQPRFHWQRCLTRDHYFAVSPKSQAK